MTVSAFNLNKPFYLYIGRKRQRVTAPAYFQTEGYFERLSNDDLSPVVQVSQTHKLFIDGKLVVSATTYPKRKYQRATIIVKKPRRGLLEIHFVKKYITIH